MIDDPDLPPAPRRRRGLPDTSQRSLAHPSVDAAGAHERPPSAPPPIDEWDLGGSEVGWAAVAPPPFREPGSTAGADGDGEVALAGASDAGGPAPTTGRDVRPFVTRALRPWFEPRPGELRGAIVLLAVALAASLALWFDASRRPEPPPMPVAVPAGPSAALDASDAGRADGSDGWGMAADVPRGPVVHVSGAVMNPGIVTLPERSRVADAIDAAGGAMPDARLDRLNLARIVEDAERVHVPRVGEDAPPPDEPASLGILPDGRIDLNAASQAELETLPGVGPARARAIIAEREARPFRVPGDLRRVPGIGEATFQRLAPLVAVR
jgi:competence protein ComEA